MLRSSIGFVHCKDNALLSLCGWYESVGCSLRRGFVDSLRNRLDIWVRVWIVRGFSSAPPGSVFQLTRNGCGLRRRSEVRWIRKRGRSQNVVSSPSLIFLSRILTVTASSDDLEVKVLYKNIVNIGLGYLQLPTGAFRYDLSPPKRMCFW